MNIALYARVSSETQAKEGTIDSQIEALREYAKKNQLSVVQEFIDEGVISLAELKEQKSKSANHRKVLQIKKTAIQSQLES